MEGIPDILMDDYTYDLPVEKIAQFPLPERDASKLLVARKGDISQDNFYNIAGHLPDHSLMVFNETRVIQARLLFRKSSGAGIEIFCLEPVRPVREIQQAFEQTSGVVWKCLIGNSKKWKTGILEMEVLHPEGSFILMAQRIQNADPHALISFRWKPPEKTFATILEMAGKTPLPPYMKREAVLSDVQRYQTIYARNEGSVAAPTAGLHFTSGVLDDLKKKHIRKLDVTLHVGAGTFQPVSANEIRSHEMHTEQLAVSKKTLEVLARRDQSVVAVGTTALRTLESLYWYGVQILTHRNTASYMDVKQWDAYADRNGSEIPVSEALEAIVQKLENQNLDHLNGQTQLIIIPGYQFKLAEVLVTNFHMPRSTLLLLVAAFIGETWKSAYSYALDHNFRFLSYGDACLFYRNS